MKEKQKNQVENEPEVNLTDIFSRRNKDENDKNTEVANNPLQEDIPEDKELVERPKDENKEDNREAFEDDQLVGKVSKTKELEEAKNQLEKLDGRYKETAKWGNDIRKKMAAYERAIKKFNDEGVLTDDEAKDLLDHTKFEDIPHEDSPPYQKYAKMWQEGLDRLREYSDDPAEIDKETYAFQQWLRDASPEALNEFWDDMDEVPNNIAAKTKKMLQKGKEYGELGFYEVYETGSIENYMNKMKENIEELKNTIDEKDKIIDKYKKKYEHYTKNPNMKIPQGASTYSANTDDDSVSLSSIFAKRK